MTFSNTSPTKLIITFILKTLILCVGSLVIFQRIIFHVAERALDNPFNLIMFAGIILFLLYKKRLDFKLIHIKPLIVPGVLLILLAIGIVFIQGETYSKLIHGSALLLYILGAFIFVFGRYYLKYLALPVLLLLIQFRVIENLLLSFSLEFQLFTCYLSNLILNGMGILTVQDGINLVMPHITLFIDQSCNGINHIMALVILSIILIGINGMTKKSIPLLIVFSFLLGLLLNSLRIVFIGIWAIFFRGEFLHGPGNIFYVTFVFTIGAIILLFLSSLMSNNKTESKKTGLSPKVMNK